MRIRVLELLQGGPRAVHELRADMGIEIEASNLSQQLAVLRRAGLVISSRNGSEVLYTLARPDVADLLQSARLILRSMIARQDELLAALQTSVDA